MSDEQRKKLDALVREAQERGEYNPDWDGVMKARAREPSPLRQSLMAPSQWDAVEKLRDERDALAARVRELEGLLEDVAPNVYRPQSSGFAEKCGHVTLALGYNWCPECWEKQVRAALAPTRSPT